MGLPENVEEVRETLRKIQKNLECPICLELLSDPYTTQCSHPFCRTCIYTVISSTREAKCPLCKMPISRRSMNENARLAEIVEAVKELEQAITKDSGVPSTPPRPLAPHSHEATGTPGVIMHSLLHPTPQKPPGTHREVAMTGRDSGNSDSGCKMRPAVASTGTTSKRHCSCSSGESGVKVKRHKRVRFASTKPTKRGKRIPRLEPSNQAALLQALEEVDFADPDVSSNSFVHTKSDELRLQNVSAIPQLEVAGGERKGAGVATAAMDREAGSRKGAGVATAAMDREAGSRKGAGVATAAMDREAGSNSPERKRPRMEHSWIPNNDFENISKVLETPGVVVSRSDQLEPLVHTQNAIVTKSRTDSITSHFSQDEEAVEGVSTSQPQRIAHSPWPVQGGNPSSCTTRELVKHTPLGAHSSEMTSETAWMEIVQETPYKHGDSQHQRTQDKYHSAVTPNPESHPELPPYKQENLGSDTMVLAEETQFTEMSTIMQTDAEGSAVPCVVEETQITSFHSWTVTQGIPLRSVTPLRGDTDKHGPPQVCCIDENQPECQAREVSLGSVPTNYCKSAAEGSTSNSPSTDGGDSTASLSSPSFIVKSSPTSLAASQPSLDHKSKGNHSVEHLDSTNSTTPDLHPESLQNGLQASPTVSSTQANAPTCSSPKSAELPILPPLFVSPPLTKTTSQWHSSSHFDDHVLSFPPYLNHSISPSIPLQNAYTSAAAPRSSATQEKTAIPDTYCTVKSGVSKVSEAQLESVPSSQLSPVARAVHTPPLPGLYRTVGGCLPGSIQEHNVTTSTSSPSSHANKRLPTNGKSDATLPNQLSQRSASPPATTVLQLTSSQVTPSGGGCPPPSLPDSLTVIPDSLLPPTKHQPSPSHDSTAQLSPHETVNAASELSMSTGSSSTALQRSSGGILSPDRDTCTQWNVKSSALSQDLTSQELEALRQQMEEKEQEILELEALLLQRKKHPSAEAQPETKNSMSKIPDSVDISLTTVAPEGTCCSHCQPENSPATRDEKCRSPNSPIQTTSTAAHQSPEITVIGETIPDSLPTITLSGVSKGARNSLLLSDSEKRQCFSEHEPSSNDSNVEYDCGEHHQGRMVSTSNAIMSKTDSQPTKQDPSTASSYSSTRTKALVEKADVLLKSLQQPLPLKETFCTRHSTKAIDLEVPKPLPPSVVKTASKGHGTLLTSQKEKEKNQTHTPGKISPSNPPVSNWLKKPSPKTSSEVVLETATKLIKALRSPPKVVLESQTTLDVDAGFFDVSPSAGGNAAAKKPKAQGFTKQQRNAKIRSPVPAAARQKANLSSRPKRKKRPLVVLDSQDLESSSPPPRCVPLPPNHPFLSISTSPYHHTSSKQSGCYPGIGEAVTTVGNASGTHTGPCEETCSLVKHHKSISDSTTSKDQAFPHEQQSLTVERKTKYITSAVGTPCIQLSGSVCFAESPPSRTTGGGVCPAESPPLCTTGGGVCPAESPPLCTTGGGVCPAESPPSRTTGGGVCPAESPPSRTTGGGVCLAESPPSYTKGGGVCFAESPPSRITGGGVCPAESPPLRTTGGSHHTKPPSFIASGLTKAQLYQAQILAKNHGGRIASCFNGSTTHIIVLTDENGCCPRTVKYLQGLAAGKWIVGYNWVKDSLEAGMLLPEAGYEVRGDSVCGGDTPHKARKLRSAGEPGLFHRHNFYLAGQFSGISQDHLAQLIQLADGTLAQTIPEAMDSRTILICDNRLTEAPAWLHCDGLAVLPSSWVLDSLSQCFLLPAKKYQH